jgi:hypothetical protein
VTDHRFGIGERVVASAFGVPPGPYEIMRMLPLADGVPFYRARCIRDGHERALSEPSLRLGPVVAASTTASPRWTRAKAR